MNLLPREPSVNTKNRESVISWLCWNDSNGCYTDTDSIGEGMPILSLEEAIGLYLDQRKG